MNNKQVMLEALEAQMLVKQNEVNEYTNTVFNVKVQELNDSILEWFHQNVRASIEKAVVSSNEVTLHTGQDRWSNRLEFSILNRWKEDPEFQFRWSSGNTSSGDKEYGIIIGRICSQLDTIKDLVMNTWISSYKQLDKDLETLQRPMNELNSSIWSLKNEMKEDQKASYMKPGFSLKLKTYKNIEWVNEEDENSRDRELRDLPGEIKLQTGRSKYDYAFIREFTVNKKTGYKYDITVVNSNDKTRNYQVTEKQFGEFIDSVITWENTGAQSRTDRAVTRFNEIMGVTA